MHFYLFWVKDSYCTCAWPDCKLQLDSVTISVICLSLSLSIPSFSITHTHPLFYPPVLHNLQFLFQSQYFPLISSDCLQGERKWSSLLPQPGCCITNTHTRSSVFSSLIFNLPSTLFLFCFHSESNPLTQRSSVPTHCLISSLSLSDKSPQAPSALLKDHMLLRGWADPNQTVTFWHTPFLLLLSIDIGLACYWMIFIYYSSCLMRCYAIMLYNSTVTLHS